MNSANNKNDKKKCDEILTYHKIWHISNNLLCLKYELSVLQSLHEHGEERGLHVLQNEAKLFEVKKLLSKECKDF